VLRILRQKIRFAQVGEPGRYRKEAVTSPAHKALAREAAQKSLVLLKNDAVGPSGRPLLPIDRAAVRRIALVGRLAATLNIGDRGSSEVRPPYVITPLEAMQTCAEGATILFDDGQRTESAVETARQADLVVAVLGYTHIEEGEYIPRVLFWPAKGGDRASLRLPQDDERLILALAQANPNLVVVMMGGSAVITEAWRKRVPAILMAWYAGMEGGAALAEILFGDANPSGKLPCVFPKSEAQLPFFDMQADTIEYGQYHGYRLMDKEGYKPAFPFGFGLSYTSYEYGGLQLERGEIEANGDLRASVEISNRGDVAGEEIAQLYIGCPESKVERPVKELKSFTRVALQPGETRRVRFSVPAGRLAYYDETDGWRVEPGEYRLYVGPSSSPESLLQASFRIVEAGAD
jgi:beta-glucosidase